MGTDAHDPGRIRRLLGTTPLAHIVTDQTGRIRALNRAAESLIGVMGGQAVGRPLSDFFADPGAYRDRLEELGRGDAVEDWLTDVVPATRESLPARVSAVPFEAGADGEVGLHWVVTPTGVERVAAERDMQLHREQAARAAMERVVRRARYVSEASRRLMGVLDPMDVWRTAAEIVAEYAPGVVFVELVGQSSLEVRAVGGSEELRHRLGPLVDRSLPLESRAESPFGVPMDRLAAALRSAEPAVVSGPDDTTHLLVPLRAHVSSRGAMILWLASDAAVQEELLVSVHVAERIALALETAVLFQEVVRARRGAEQASAAEADFLAVVSHELRTPLMAIVSYAELLEQRADELPEKVGRYARQIAAAAAHQRQLVEQILSYRRLQQGDDDYSPEELDFRQAAQFAMAMARPSARSKPMELELRLPDEPVRGKADVGKLRQILTNLLTNAIRHTHEGHVRLVLETDKPWVVFRVEDTGEGIPPDLLPRIFDRFWRGPSEVSQSRGSGLGLTITRELVALMRGEIAVRSEPGKGTTFTVRLPLVAEPDASR
jgi:PAS domain S-box-containing protein